jgi:integrase
MKRNIKREFGSIRDLASGKFQASYKFEGRTKYNPKSFLTKVEAKNWLASEHYKILRGLPLEPKPKKSDVTFGQCARRYLETKTNRLGYPLSPNYVAKSEYLLRGKLAGFAGRSIESITPKMIEDWWSKETRNGHRASTAFAYRFMRAVFNRAIRDEERLGVNPCQIVGAGSAQSGRELNAFSEEDLRSVIRASSRQFAMYLTLSFVAALRFEESSALRKCDVVRGEFNGNVTYSLRISRAVVRVHGEFLIVPPKSEEGKRITHLPRSIYPQLEGFLQELGGGPEALLFPSKLGGTFTHHSVLNKQLKTACEAAGLDPRNYSLHSLRRAGATALAQNGGTLAEVRKLLGDKSFAAAMLYVKPTSRLESLIEKFDVSGVSPDSKSKK